MAKYMTRPPAEARAVEAIALDLHQVAIHLLRRLRRHDEAIGLSPARLSALSVLLHGPVSLSDLARAEQVTPPSMNRTVTALESSGLVTRSRSRTDGRAVVVALTAKGTSAIERGRSLRVQHLSTGLARLAAAELRQLDAALAILNRVNAEP